MGANGVSVTIDGVVTTKDWLKSLKKETRKKLGGLLSAGGKKIRNQAIRNAPVDEGALRNSMVSTDLFSNDKLVVEIGPTVSYGASVEFGSRPHTPPIEPLKGWARRHGLDEGFAWYLQKRIAREGGRDKPFLIPAFNKYEPQVMAGVEKIIKEMQ